MAATSGCLRLRHRDLQDNVTEICRQTPKIRQRSNCDRRDADPSHVRTKTKTNGINLQQSYDYHRDLVALRQPSTTNNGKINTAVAQHCGNSSLISHRAHRYRTISTDLIASPTSQKGMRQKTTDARIAAELKTSADANAKPIRVLDDLWDV